MNHDSQPYSGATNVVFPSSFLKKMYRIKCHHYTFNLYDMIGVANSHRFQTNLVIQPPTRQARLNMAIYIVHVRHVMSCGCDMVDGKSSLSNNRVTGA